MRKLLTLLLVVAMLFGMATTSFAYTDVTAAAQTGPVEKLSALSIIKGYSDGTFKPENPITRAEFAAVIVRAMGLEAAAKLINSPTKFTDVTADHAWAYGYINIASAKGIIKGDPDGKFRPGDKVSFAEAITMILRAGGWDAACANMDWPAGFVMKAVEFGLTKDVAFDANAAANRGAVALMVYNALAMPMAMWNDTAKVYQNSEATLAGYFLKATEKTVIVTSVPDIDSALKANQVVTADGTMYVPAGVNPNTLLGREVRVIKIGDTYVYAVDATPSARILTGMSYTDNGEGSFSYVDSDDNEFTKDIADDAVFVMNGIDMTWGDFTDEVGDDDDLVIFLNASGEIRFIIAKYWDHAQYLVADKYTKGVDGETVSYFVLSCDCEYNILANTVFMKNGKAATYADLAVGDIAYVQSANGDDATLVELYNTKVTGKVTAVSLNAKGEAVLTVNGTNYVVDNFGFGRFVTLDGDAIDKSGIGGFVNFDVTLKLDVTGKALVVSGTTTALIGWVTKTPAAGVTDKISVNVKGVVTEYTTTVNISELVKDDYVALTQRADGKVTSFDVFELSGSYTVKAIDTANKKLTLADGSATPVLSVVKYADSAFGVRLGVWGDVSVLKTGDLIRYWAPSATIKYFEVNPSFAGHVYGKFIGMTSVEGTLFAYVNVKGEVKTYETTDATPASGIVDVKLNSVGVATDIEAVTIEGGNVYAVNTISGNIFTVTRLADTVVQVHDLSSAIVYKADGSLGSLSDLKVNVQYNRVMNGTTVVLVQIVEAD